MKKENIADIYQLSPLQQGILFHTLCEVETGIYLIQLCYRLQGQLNLKAFEQAWQKVVDKHTILRTSFHWEKLEQPLQVVSKQVPIKIQFEDWSEQYLAREGRGLPSLREQEDKLERWLVRERNQGFNLSVAPLMRWTIIRRGQDDYYFVWSKHHLILDGWSTALILKEVIEIYQNQARTDLEPIPYREYIAWLQQQDLTQAKNFWKTQLQGIKTPTSLMIGREANKETGKKEEVVFKLAATTTKKLQKLTQENQLTLSSIIQGAWALLLQRYTSDADIVYGVTVAGRPSNLSGAERMVGLFINTLPVRVEIVETDRLLPWLKQLQTQLLEIRQYEYTPLVEIQGWSEIGRDLQLFESIVVLENYPVDSSLQQPGSLAVESISTFDYTNYPLTLTVIPGVELSLSLAYTTCRFDTATIKRMLGHMQTLLEGMVNNPQTKLIDLPLLSAQEDKQLQKFNQTKNNIDEAQLKQCIHQLIENQAKKSPDAVAVVWGKEKLTYGELNQKSLQSAEYLQLQGVKPEVIVGICCDRSLEMIIAIVAILKAGGAYLPLDPNLPKEAITWRIEDAGVAIVLAPKQLQAKIAHKDLQIIDLDLRSLPQVANLQPPKPPNPDNLAYVIYTSGSTGKPKGVMVNHRSLVNAYLGWSVAYELNQVKNHLQMANFAFDVFTGDVVRALCSGGKLVLCPGDTLLEAEKLYQLILQQQIEIGEFVPVVLRHLMEYLEKTQQQLNMGVVICGSDSWYGREYNQFRKFLAKNCRLINSFGVTEATIDSCYFETTDDIASGQLVPIGKPFVNTQLYILDAEKRSLPIGVTGELYIGGLGVARGYLNRPQLNCEKFLNLDSYDTPLYKTGDKARYLPNGDIEFLGRIDNQVKLRGFRIELGEIEAILYQYPQIAENVVILRQDSPGEAKIVAYLVTETNKPVGVTELRNFLREKLPEYALPSAFVFLKKLPLSPNGKIDRKSLPIPSPNCYLNNNYTPASNAIEEILVDIWAKILQLPRVGIEDNFFDLGGHSLLATQVISRIREAFAIELAIRCLFESPTVAQLAKRIVKQEKSSGITLKRAIILKKVANMSSQEAKELLQAKKTIKS